MNSNALTKIQSIALIAIILAAVMTGGITYVLWRAGLPPPEAIRIGLSADLDKLGKSGWQAALLAAEQVNAEGGVLGRNITIVAEDDDNWVDLAVATNALTRLITVDKADFVVSTGAIGLVQQDVCSEHKKILITYFDPRSEYTQRVLDDYDKYKYYFRVYMANTTAQTFGHLQGLAGLKNYTGFTKLGYLIPEASAETAPILDTELPKLGFELVYRGRYAGVTTDFSSNFAAAEASGAEILFTIITASDKSVSFVKEWCDRQAPLVVWGDIYLAGNEPGFWNLTEGKTEYIATVSTPTIMGYPLTSKTLPFRDAFLEKWGTVPKAGVAAVYDIVRFILPDAIKRAGTTETEAVIKTLETTSVETVMARHFAFTSSHDVMVGESDTGELGGQHLLYMVAQWQGGTQVPVYPGAIMKEAGATYKYPPWQGPWSSKQLP